MNFKLIHGDALRVLRGMPDESVHCCVTSPPYWGLRDYKLEPLVWGGDAGCKHNWAVEGHRRNGRDSDPTVIKSPVQRDTKGSTGSFCSLCGAWRGSLGLEPTPELYVQHLVEIFREVRRVLRRDGTLWLNLGDSYAGSWGAQGHDRITPATLSRNQIKNHPKRASHTGTIRQAGLKPKDLIGVPWMMAFALRSDGWWLRSDIIWSKPNPMPESVTDRPTKAHEYIFLLAKSGRYYYDAEAIREPTLWPDGPNSSASIKSPHGQGFTRAAAGWHQGSRGSQPGGTAPRDARLHIQGNLPARSDGGASCNKPRQEFRNRRSVWTVSTCPTPEAHFATYPPDLIEPCILAGCPPAGKRCDCDELIFTPTGTGPSLDPTQETGRKGMNRERRPDEGHRVITRREQRGYAEQIQRSPYRAEMGALAGPALAHYIRTDKAGARPLPPELLEDWLARGWLTEPALCSHPVEEAGRVLDPFAGAGTTGLACLKHGRKFIGIELSAEYVKIAQARAEKYMPLLVAGE